MILTALLAIVTAAAAVPTDLLKDVAPPTEDANIIPIYKQGFNAQNLNMLEYEGYSDELINKLLPYRRYYIDDLLPLSYRKNYFSKYMFPNYEQDMYSTYPESFKQQYLDMYQQYRPYNYYDQFRNQDISEYLWRNYYAHMYPLHFDREFGYPSMHQYMYKNYKIPQRYPFNYYNYMRYDDLKSRPLPSDFFYNYLKPIRTRYNVPQLLKTQLKLNHLKPEQDLIQMNEHENLLNLRESSELLKKRVPLSQLVGEAGRLSYPLIPKLAEHQLDVQSNVNDKIVNPYINYRNINLEEPYEYNQLYQ